MTRLIKIIAVSLPIALFISCAKVPQQAVDLSATVGRDLVVVHESHKTTAKLVFSKMKEDVNEFVDDVYAPYQIGKLLEQDYEDFESGNTESLVAFIQKAASNSADAASKKRALEAMEFFVTYVQSDIEDYRKELLSPILSQEREVLNAIDKSYNQLIYAQSIVTAHIASVKKVHDSQEEILNLFGVEDLRTKTADKLTEASGKIDDLLNKIEGANIDEIDSKLRDAQSKIKDILNKD